jgi:hypothetical protein
MVASKSFAFLLTATVVSFGTFAGCAAPTGAEGDVADPGGDQEEEPVGQSNDELRSTVSCQERTDLAYQGGKPFSIQVIHVGGKPTTKATGHAFLKMQAAANAEGVRLSLTSGFRTMAEQKHLYDCYLNRSCNNGNLAARPGYSNHQSGLALDVSTSSWLTHNASKFGFVRTVSQESWHYEYHGRDPGGPCTRGTSSAAAVGSDTPPSNGSDPAPGSAPAQAPTPAAGGLSWVAPTQDAMLKNGFAVKAHATKPSIVKVVYSQGTLDFGTSTKASDDFSLSYTFQYMGDKTLTAKGYDANGGLVSEDHVDFTLLP